MRAFWDHSTGNFGDELGPYLLGRLAGVSLERAEPERAELFGIGSIAESIPPGYDGIVFGSGKMFGGSGLDLRHARVLALRGALTAEGSRATCDLLAEPGLLAGLTAPVVERDIRIGAIPHYVDDATDDAYRGATVIDVRWPPERIIAWAARCRAIVTSSLHGLVLADSLGVPSQWVDHPGVLGGGFKFRDYASGMGESLRPGVWRQADPAVVLAKQRLLQEALALVAAPA